MHPLLKAFILTLFMLLMGYLLAAQFDNARAGSLKNEIGAVLQENQERVVLLHYSRVMDADPKAICPNLLELRKQQLERVYRLDLKISDYERNNLFNEEYLSLKTSYFIGAVDLLVSAEENRRLCGVKETPLVLFYRQYPGCPDCKAQSALLQKVGQRCQAARVYSFPIDSDSQAVKVLVDRYHAQEVPAISIDDGPLSVGIMSEEEAVQKLRASGAQCS